MTWNEQAQSMAKFWTDAQQKMLANWYDMFQTAPSPMMLPMNMYEQWFKLLAEGNETWRTGAEAVSSNIYQQFLSTQGATMRFVDLSTKAMQAMGPKIEAGEDWQTVLNEYTEQFRRQFMADPTSWMQASKDVTELWQLYLKELQGLARPWTDSFQRVPGHMGEMFGGTNGSSELVELTSLYWDAYERTFGRLVQSPSVGFTREMNEKLLKGFDAWQDFRRASIDYQLVLANSWTKVFENVMQTAVERAEQGKPIESIRDLVRLWTGAADNTLADVFRTEEYIQAQGKLFTTTMNYRLQEQQIVEIFLQTSYIPTRSEVDEAHRNIYELRKEVKALKKSLKHAQAGETGGKSPVSDLRKEVNALKKALKEVQEANGRAPEEAVQN